MKSEKYDSEYTEKDLLQNKVPVLGISPAAVTWQTTWARLYKACWMAL